MAAKKTSPQTSNPASPAPEGKLSKFQKFRFERLSRSLLKNAEYNPRFLDEAKERKLRATIERMGLVDAPVWNRRTGNLVGGHQRVAAIDSLEKTQDYELDVQVIDVTPKRERELNIALNNPALAGEYDIDLLGPMLKDGEFGIKAEDVGFDAYDLETLFEGTDFEDLYQPPASPEDAEGSAGAINAIGVMEAPVPADEGAPNGRLENGEAIRDPVAHAKIIAEREAMRDRIANDPLRDDNFTLFIVCGTAEERLELGVALSAKENFVDCRLLYEKLGLKRPTEEQI